MRSPKIIVLAAAVAAAALVILVIQVRTSALPTAVQAPSATTTLATSTGDVSRTSPTPARGGSAPAATTPAASLARSATTSVSTQTATAIDPSVRATITFGGISHPVAVSANETIEDAMKTLQSEGAITYTVQNYSGLGDLVESINGRASANDQYWILYVNGKQSDTGISTTPIHAGDTVSWNYEHGY